jgi:5-hydroxyisourate hydrolase
MSIHVVDVARGLVAQGMRIEVHQLGKSADAPLRTIAKGETAASGLLEDAALAAVLAPGRYRVVFHVGDYYRKAGVKLPDVPFLDVVAYDFGIADSRQHYHLPFKCTPWGYSCFRGGA